MAYSNSNIRSLIAARIRNDSDDQLAGSLASLSSGWRINFSQERCFNCIDPASFGVGLSGLTRLVEQAELQDQDRLPPGSEARAKLDISRVALENISAADRAVKDADFAVEVAYLTKAQILAGSVKRFLKFPL